VNDRLGEHAENTKQVREELVHELEASTKKLETDIEENKTRDQW
jgi:hypothetical protein